MKIYVIERMYDELVQLGWSSRREIAEAKAKEYKKQGIDCWVEEYILGADGYCEFG